MAGTGLATILGKLCKSAYCAPKIPLLRSAEACEMLLKEMGYLAPWEPERTLGTPGEASLF